MSSCRPLAAGAMLLLGMILPPRATAQALADTVPADTSAAEQRAVHYAERYRIPLDLARSIVDAARSEGLDPELGFRLVRVESVFHPNARGRSGGLGLVQLLPGTARSVDRSMDSEEKILEPNNNLRVGFRYLRQMIARYKGDVRLGLLAYNRGEVSVDRALKRGADPENGYSHKVLGTPGGNPYQGAGVTKP